MALVSSNTTVVIRRLTHSDAPVDGMVDPWDNDETGVTRVAQWPAALVRPAATADRDGGGNRERTEWICLLPPTAQVSLGDEVVSAAGVIFQVQTVTHRPGPAGATDLAHVRLGLVIVNGVGGQE